MIGRREGGGEGRGGEGYRGKGGREYKRVDIRGRNERGM